MTLICAHKNEQNSFIISDFRLTAGRDKTHYDKLVKFLSFDEKMGLFLAGDVNFWKQASISIQHIVSDITEDNYCDIDAPFWQELSSEAMKFNGNKSGAIGFILGKNNHNIFNISIQPGQGAIIEELKDNECLIIGSGRNIPELNNKLSSTYKNVYNYYDGDTYCIASSFRTTIIEEMKKLGSKSFEKLGISPIMSISILENNYFKVCGEELNGGDYSNNTNYEYSYQLKKDERDNIVLSNTQDNNTIKIININEIVYEEDEQIFDPANITKQYDPSNEFNNNYVYSFEQECLSTTAGVLPNTILRIIDRIDFITSYRFCDSKHLYIATKENLDSNEYSKYLRPDKYYFELDTEKEIRFFAELCSEKLFDDSWLNKFLPSHITNKLCKSIQLK